MWTASTLPKPPYTQALRRALEGVNDSRMEADLLFLEAWEIRPSPNLGVTLRAGQIRRANPELAAAIDAELKAKIKGSPPS
jgi:hypothetical protein